MRHMIMAAIVSAAGVLSMPAQSQEAAPSVGAATAVSPFKKDLERGYSLKRQKRDEEAAAVFAAVLVKDPSNHAALTELGYLQAGLKHYNAAVKHLTAASAQDPDDMRLRMDLGYAAQAAKKYKAAKEQFSVVAGRPGVLQTQAQTALESLPAATVAATPAEARQRRLLERGYAELKRGEKAAAAKTFEAAVAGDPKDASALKQLGFIDLDMGRVSAAAANFEAARALEPTDYFVALQLGYTYERLQKKEMAQAEFVAASASTDEKIHGAAVAALQSAAGPGAPLPAPSM